MNNNILSLLINIFFFSIQMIISAYFIHSYLTPKFGRKSFIGGFLILMCLIYVIMNYFYSNIPMRMILSVLFLEIVSLFLYEGKFFKKILAGPIIFCCNALSEVVIQLILVFILDMPIFVNLTSTTLFIIVFLNTLMFFILIKIFLQFFSKSFLTTQQYSKLFLSSILTLFLIAIIISESLYINQLVFVIPNVQNYNLSFIVLSICFILSLILNIYIYHSIKSLKSDISKQTISQLLQDEYLIQMDNYLIFRNTQEQSSHLRHDIMNYIQTTITLKEKKNE